MTTEVIEGDKRKNFTATATIEGGGHLIGILVASTTSGTVAVADGAGVILGTTAVVAGQFYPLPCKWIGTLTITVANTLNATVFYKV